MMMSFPCEVVKVTVQELVLLIQAPVLEPSKAREDGGGAAALGLITEEKSPKASNARIAIDLTARLFIRLNTVLRVDINQGANESTSTFHIKCYTKSDPTDILR